MYQSLGENFSIRGSRNRRVTSFLGELFGEGMTLKSVAVALDVDNSAMVQHAIKDGRRDDRISKEFLPVGEAFVRRDDSRTLLIAVGDELKEEIRLLACYR